MSSRLATILIIVLIIVTIFVINTQYRHVQENWETAQIQDITSYKPLNGPIIYSVTFTDGRNTNNFMTEFLPPKKTIKFKITNQSLQWM